MVVVAVLAATVTVAVLAATVTVLVSFVVAAVVAGQESGVNVAWCAPPAES